MMVLVFGVAVSNTYAMEVWQWKLRTNFALCPLMPSLASNLKVALRSIPQPSKVVFSSIMLFSVLSKL